jgi:hypothetical protein
MVSLHVLLGWALGVRATLAAVFIFIMMSLDILVETFLAIKKIICDFFLEGLKRCAWRPLLGGVG